MVQIDPEIDALFRSAKKRAQNEVAFQKTNGILMDKAKELVIGPERKTIALAFTCECSDMHCSEDIHLTIHEFERVVRHPAWFCICAEHNQPDIEKVVEEHDEYWIVAKLPGLLGEED